MVETQTTYCNANREIEYKEFTLPLSGAYTELTSADGFPVKQLIRGHDAKSDFRMCARCSLNPNRSCDYGEETAGDLNEQTTMEVEILNSIPERLREIVGRLAKYNDDLIDRSLLHGPIDADSVVRILKKSFLEFSKQRPQVKNMFDENNDAIRIVVGTIYQKKANGLADNLSQFRIREDAAKKRNELAKLFSNI